MIYIDKYNLENSHYFKYYSFGEYLYKTYLPQSIGSSRQEWWLHTVIKGVPFGLLSSASIKISLLCTVTVFNQSKIKIYFSIKKCI